MPCSAISGGTFMEMSAVCLLPTFTRLMCCLKWVSMQTSEVVSLPMVLKYPSLDIAVEEIAEQIILSNDEMTRTELRQLLQGWLVERDGMLMPPGGETVGAIITLQK